MLRLGLNFTPAPTKLPLVDTIAAVEEGARQRKKRMHGTSVSADEGIYAADTS